MSGAGSMASDDLLCGVLEAATRARGSKSEHTATMLRDEAGQLHALRRAGGPPFTDPALQALEGCRVTLRGQRREGYFLILHIETGTG